MRHLRLALLVPRCPRIRRVHLVLDHGDDPYNLNVGSAAQTPPQ